MEARGSRIRLHWSEPGSGRPRVQWAGPDELLGLKIVLERPDLDRLARDHGLSRRHFYRLLSRLDRTGILKAPSTLLRRDPKVFGRHLPDELLTLTGFGIQWHVTQRCDLHCKHCYDRSDRDEMTEAQALRALDELERFCADHWVVGEIALTGGNPFLYRGFFELYEEVVRRGIPVSLMGNPVRSEWLERLCRIQPPLQFQVSLEGRRAKNDAVRGPGTYDETLAFLRVLKRMGIPSGVMLTLTANNLGEVLPLARLLEDRADGFSFCRLSQTGEGANLTLPPPGGYRALARRYLAYTARSRIAGHKENLLSLVRYENGEPPVTGCTGAGCALGFDGVCLLADGEAHACRKFPSAMGNLWRQSLEEIYFSEAGRTFRRGMQACDGCPLRAVCGGCAAASHRPGGSVTTATDPCCWRLWGSADREEQRAGP